ncbi:hypothetical protein PspLS_08258 [Pyricularia sp. CBS 133598]|nr:hypothetical protein PspLS_08258 [Pyricularia sp. CBS 133598]
MLEWMKPKAWYLPEIERIKSPDGDFYLPFNKGGFCPIELDVLLNERYRVIAFAGNDSFAMVWVAIDEKQMSGGSPFDEEHQSVEDIRLIDFGESFVGAKRGINTHSYNTPPELIEDEEATCKADVWSLGYILWHLWFDCSQSERKEKLVAYVDEFYGDGSAKKPAFDALLDLILDCIEPNPDDPPTAHDIVSSRIWEEKMLPAISETSEDSPDDPTGAEQPFEETESAFDQTMPESDVLVPSQNEDLGGDASASRIVTVVSDSPEAPKSSAEGRGCGSCGGLSAFFRIGSGVSGTGGHESGSGKELRTHLADHRIRVVFVGSLAGVYYRKTNC